MNLPTHCADAETTASAASVDTILEDDYYYLWDNNDSLPTTSESFKGPCYTHLQAEHDNFLHYEVVVGGYMTVILGLFGLVGNTLSILVLCRKELRKNCFNQLLIGLVTCDILHILFGILEAFRLSFSAYYPQSLLSVFPWFHYPFYRITLAGSIYMMVGVAIERYLAVCFPHNYHTMKTQSNRALYYVVPAIGAALLINIPRFFETKAIIKRSMDANCTAHDVIDVQPTELRYDPNYIIIYVNWIWTVSTGFLPFFALIILNGRIFHGLRRVQRNLNRHKRLVDRATAAAAASTIVDNPATDDVSCVVQVRMDNNQESKGQVELIALRDVSPGKQSVASVTYNNGIDTELQANNDGEYLQVPTPNGEGHATLQLSPSSMRSKQPSIRQRARTAAQRRLQSAAQSKEANMAVVLVCTVSMFLICHLPRMYVRFFEAFTAQVILGCQNQNQYGVPIWYLYFPPVVKLLMVLNASVNFPIYYLMGTTFKKACHSLLHID